MPRCFVSNTLEMHMPIGLNETFVMNGVDHEPRVFMMVLCASSPVWGRWLMHFVLQDPVLNIRMKNLCGDQRYNYRTKTVLAACLYVPFMVPLCILRQNITFILHANGVNVRVFCTCSLPLQHFMPLVPFRSSFHWLFTQKCVNRLPSTILPCLGMFRMMRCLACHIKPCYGLCTTGKIGSKCDVNAFQVEDQALDR